MTADGVLVGEIAHIEGPLTGSPRFRQTMTNEQRRAYANLVLMCAACHTIIDRDLDKWSVEKLHDLKSRHEGIYTGAVDLLRRQVGDLTEGTVWTAATNLGRLPGVQGQTREELEWSVQVVNDLAARLAGLPVGARSIIAIIINRGDAGGVSGGWEPEISIPVSLLNQIVDCTADELSDYLTILDHANLVKTDWKPFDGPPVHELGNSTAGVGWRLFSELKSVAAGDANMIRGIIVDLDFTPLDS
jgi:hypothetical protein